MVDDLSLQEVGLCEGLVVGGRSYWRRAGLDEHLKSGEGILGDSEFVEDVLREADEHLDDHFCPPPDRRNIQRHRVVTKCLCISGTGFTGAGLASLYHGRVLHRG